MSDLPDRLIYEEYPVGTAWAPVVRCKVLGCEWVYYATWDEFGDDGVDWEAEHPAHPSPADTPSTPEESRR